MKSRALTLSYAVATVDEIFAVAKDLLKTEIDYESPQPLRLRLMGNYIKQHDLHTIIVTILK